MAFEVSRNPLPSTCLQHHYFLNIKEGEIGRACRTYGEERGAYRIMVWKPEGKSQLGKPRSRWDYNVKMDLKEIR
jgi:hypothetical protein